MTEPEREPTIIRPSALSRYPDCNRRGAANLFRREIQAAGFNLRIGRRGIGAVIGSACHDAAATTLLEKARTGELPPASLATDAALESFNARIAEGPVVYEPPTHDRAIAVRQVLSMTRAYHREIAPQVQPILVEERLEADIAPGFVLSGQPDVVCREPNRIRDQKTGARGPGSHAPQLGAYAMLVRANGLDVAEAAIDFVKRVPPQKPQPPPITKAVRLAQAETAAASIIAHMQRDLHVFRHGDPERHIGPGDPWAFQANPLSNLCHPKYCPAFGTEFCHEGDLDKLNEAA
jgi:hypothetical protein